MKEREREREKRKKRGEKGRATTKFSTPGRAEASDRRSWGHTPVLWNRLALPLLPTKDRFRSTGSAGGPSDPFNPFNKSRDLLSRFPSTWRLLTSDRIASAPSVRRARCRCCEEGRPPLGREGTVDFGRARSECTSRESCCVATRSALRAPKATEPSLTREDKRAEPQRDHRLGSE